MVDCGATALFISEKFVKENKVRTNPLDRKIRLCNIDGSENRAGSIARSARLHLQVGDSREWLDFMVTNLGPEDLVLGLPWLRKMNPVMRRRRGSTREYVQRDDFEPRARRGGAPA